MKKHSLIIGGTRGLGRELVRTFLADGQTVSVIGKREPPAQDRDNADVSYYTCDVVDTAALAGHLQAIVERHGKLSSLVLLHRFRGTDDHWSGEIETSLSATRFIIEALKDQFSEHGDRSIVAVSSIADEFISESQPAGYHVAKAGLVQLVRYYAVTLGPSAIRVNCVSPSTIVKEENRQFYSGNPALQDLFRKTIPLGRMGTARESAAVIAFLCSSRASFVTGQKITVDGGVSLVSQESLARKLTNV